MQRTVKNHKNQKGFTLMELAVGLLVASLILAAGLSVYNTGKTQDAVLLTHKRIDHLTQVLAQYGDANGRVPCPADPAVSTNLFGWEKEVDQALVDQEITPRPDPADTCRDWGTGEPEGIVPFLSLGLRDEDARDGWGRYFTYAVSPVFAQINDETPETAGGAAGVDTGSVHLRCLNTSWMEHIDDEGDGIDNTAIDYNDGVDGGEVFDNVNSIKAKFCCARDGNAAPFLPATDLEILFSRTSAALYPYSVGGEVYDNVRDHLAPESYGPINPTALEQGAPYGPITNDFDGPLQAHEIDDDASSIAAVAYVLVSHGANGFGAYLANNLSSRYLNNAGSAGEDENQDGDQRFFEGPPGGSVGSGFDDIVVWRTQISLMAEAGSSCAVP